MMAEEQPGAVRVRPWIRRTARILLPILLLIAAWQVWDNIEARRLDPLVTKLRDVAARGPRQPITDPPDAENAARYYAAAAMFVEQNPRGGFDAKYRHIVRAQREALAGGAPAPEWMGPAMTKALAHNQSTLDLIERGAEAEFYGFAWSRRNVTQWASLSDAARVEAMRTIDRLMAGDSQAAARSLVSRIRYLRAYDHEVGLATFRKSTDLQSIAGDLPLLLAMPDVADADLDAIERALAPAYEGERSERLLAQLVLFPFGYIEQAWLGRSWQYASAGVLLRPALRHALVPMMRVANDAVDAAALPWPERIRVVESLRDDGVLWTPRGMTGIRQVAPMLRSSLSLYADGMMVARASRVAVAADRHRRMTGALPASLSDVVPATEAVDVFTGEPLRYVREPDGFAVYSVSRNRADDNGALLPVLRKGQRVSFEAAPDVGVRVVYRRAAAAAIRPSNSERNSPVR
jgi:hypothetical protein